MIKETRHRFSPKDLLDMINKTYGKGWKEDQFSMSSKGAIVVVKQDM